MAWEKIRGHDAARQQLQAAFTRGRLGQAYLLVGPEGVGKQLFARELAKALLCERPPAPLTACDHCPSCSQVAAATHPDVLAVGTPAGKNELPIELMREFCEWMAMKPGRGTRKIGIVLDADDFNDASANSFLKTLEEPPPGSLLLLLATSLERQLPTILSRCQVVQFSPLRPEALRAVLKEQGIEEEKLDRLIAVGGGSVSQALALNDVAFDEVRRQLVEGITSPRPNFSNLAEAWNRFNEEAGKESSAQRLRASLVLRLLIETIRQAMRLSVGADVPGLDRGEVERLKSFAERVGPDRLVELIDRCLEADVHVGRYVQLVLVVESVLEPLTRAG